MSGSDMEEAKKFGARLKVLRIRAGLTQRGLAHKVGVDFTYLSKIENGVIPPPSEKVILQLAGTLNVDKDELMALAGKIPADIAEMLKNREALQFLRSGRVQKKVMASTRKEKGVHLLDDFEKLPKTIKAHKNYARVIIAIVLVMAVGILLWYASPVTDTAVAANNQGLIYNTKGEYDKAIVSFNEALELNPSLAVAYSNRGWAHIELGQYEQGIADCGKAIELDPKLAFAYSNRGLAYIKLRQYERGIADCTKAIELNPGLAAAYSNRGLAYIELGQYEKGIADCDKAIELDPTIQKG